MNKLSFDYIGYTETSWSQRRFRVVSRDRGNTVVHFRIYKRTYIFIVGRKK